MVARNSPYPKPDLEKTVDDAMAYSLQACTFERFFL